MKTIAVICDYVLRPDRIGGMDRFYVEYDRRAKELGYEVHWYFSSYTPFNFFEGLTIFSAKGDAVESFFLEKNIKNKYEILVTHFTALCTSFYKHAKKMGVDKIIAVDHNPRPLEGFPLSKRVKNKIKGVMYSRYIDQFVGVSKYTKKHILKDYGFYLNDKTIVIYNGIDSSVYEKRTQPNKNKFIVTSHLRFSKGIQDLLQAVSILPDNLKNRIEIDIFGEGPYENELKEQCAKLNLTKLIHFKGSTSHLNQLFTNYSYMLQPTYMECFSLSILESLAANVPVVTTTVGGNLEVITHAKNGFIFETGNVIALSAILKRIILGTLKIATATNTLIEEQYNLDTMVENHLSYIK
ncbi:Glycosyltransferase involved in cell wall bisynthesis [Lutibacter agarilyticus]|uniref:Glycosyltransferase involved in cell wall bisynthesis n=1 Tax=Lutibacter agarilyticus TaxID=1109740 RepID=A0A238YYR4_9FLAO|nr:glycosyltransferase family 4 protein [Lutibacter agarilyticus]SNR75848.1 Glycosyltransferase involved in cell wall bisynthesis [Lutibacter agarilyticus]